ncbi:hypothetical protein AAFF_G00029170 [Aldrovandia affinis]|uniref:Uncharacterized protein n=1 Tax=Aldrovandia affinis TaxID=143900 RepID=A0AAD7S483_9TELE|nr:hypothetical protein AAFF_G00029170 [Aldrovandia affinis]
MMVELSAIYDTLGVSAEDTLSPEDIQSVYQRVFHTPVSQQDTLRAVRKVTGDDEGTTCHARKILYILLEIEKENVLKEERLNKGGRTQDQRGNSLYVWRLKKDVRRICSRLSSEGLQHVIPSVYHGAKSTGPAGPHGLRELWSPCANLLQQIDDKYDIIRQKLCTEMLQDHYGNLSWEALLPWQQKERVEDLAAQAECSLESADLLCLSELPGAFRLYRSWDRAILRLCPEQVNPKVLEWTAVLSLKELHSCHQLEKRGLAALIKSLDGTSLRRLSLYVQLMVMRAESEKHSHGALLAASQSWGNWPDVRDPHCRDLAKFWLGEQSPLDSDRRTATFSRCSPQQAVLQCMLLCQEGERECLIKLLHSLIPEELQGPEEQSSHSTGIFLECPAALRKPCIVRLKQMKGALRGAVSWGSCALELLTHLMKLQEAEVWAVIQDLQKAVGKAQVYSTENPQEIRNNVEGEQERPASGSERRELCSACGHTLAPEEIPYLEVLHATSNQEEPYGESRANEKGEDAACDVAVHFEKQGSLIAVAWGKPAEEANNQVVSDALVEPEAAPSLEQEENSDNLHLQKAPKNTGEESSDSTFFQSSPRAARHQDQPDQGNASAGKLSPSDPTTHEARAADNIDKENSGQTMDGSSKGLYPDVVTDSIFDECSGKPEHFQEQPMKEAASAGKMGAKGFQREATIVHLSEMECEETMKSLVDIQRKVESRYQRDKERQMFRIQERLSIIQNRKSDEDLLGHRQGDSLKDLTENFKQEDRHRQKTLVKEKLEQLRRERSHVMQSKRDRNMSAFKELLDPVVLNKAGQEDGVNF